MKHEQKFGRLPVIDGPWKGGCVECSVGTFEVAGDEPLEFANPLTISPPGIERVRYYRQRIADGWWVWSTAIPDTAAELLQAEAEAAAALLPE